MFNFLIKIEYDGTNYVGWQSQKNGKAVQDNIEKALKKIFRIKIRLVGAGRTDKGVHARAQYANFIIERKINDKKSFINSINFFLNKSLITIVDLKRKNLNFHSRYSAKERVYEYLIINRLGSLSIDRNRAWHIRKKLDIKLLKRGAKILEGTHNYSTFRASSCSAKSPIRKINSIKVFTKEEKIFIIVKSKSFLQNQVRSMVGCLEKLASNKWDFKKFKKVFKSQKRKNCAPPAPACGLYLRNVKY